MRIPEIITPMPHFPTPNYVVSPIATALSQAGGQIANMGADLYTKQKQFDDVQAATQLWLDASDQLSTLEVDLKKDPDHQTHVERWLNGYFDAPTSTYKKGVKDIEKETMGRAGENRDVAKFLSQKFAQYKIVEGERQKLYAFELGKDQAVSNMVTQLETLKEKAATTEDWNRMSEYMALGVGQINAARASGAITETQATLKREQFLGDMEKAQIKRDMMRDPLGTAKLLEEGYYPKTNANEAIDYIRQAMVLHEHRERQRIQAEEKAEKEREKFVRQTQDETAYALNIKTRTGKYNLDEILNAAERRDIRPEQFDHLMTIHNTIQEKIAKKGEALTDPDIKRELWPDLLSLNPKTSERQLTDLWKAEKIADKDYDWAMDRVRQAQEKRRADQEKIISQAESESRLRHNQAEQLLKTYVSPKGPMEALDQTEWYYWQWGLGELTKRSSAFNGKEDPIAVVEELKTQLQVGLKGHYSTSESQLKSLLKYQTKQELENAWKAKRIPESVYDSQRDLWNKLDEIQSKKATIIPEAEKKPEKKKIGILGW